MRTLLLSCLIISLSAGCASISGLTVAEDRYPYSDYAADDTIYPDYCPNHPDCCQAYPDWYGYYPDELWYSGYYPYYPYYRYLYRLDDGNDDKCLFFRDYRKQITKSIAYRREVRRKVRETRIASFNHAREKQRELRISRMKRIRSGLEQIRPRHIFRTPPGRWGRR